MNCCAQHTGAAQKCFGWMSRLYERRYRRKGLDRAQRHMVEAMERLGLQDARVLEIGCGVGELHQTLLQRGAAHALGVDLAPRMLELAEQRASDRDLGDRTDYRLGDFVEMATDIEPADVTVLDKVVCCYPAPKALLGAAVSRTRRVIALSYPRGHMLSRFWNGVWNFGFWLLRSEFRGFVHDPGLLSRLVESGGFRRVLDERSLFWHTRVYVAGSG